MEDQPADSGNLTTDSAVGATPQQAADRRGHRLALTRKRVEDPVTDLMEPLGLVEVSRTGVLSIRRGKDAG